MVMLDSNCRRRLIIIDAGQMCMRDAFIGCKVRRYLWSHPDLMPSMGVEPVDGKFGMAVGSRRAYTLPTVLPDLVVERMIREGDKSLEEAWAEDTKEFPLMHNAE